MRKKLLEKPVTDLVTSHVTKGGNLYIPREIGGVQINVEDIEDGFRVTIAKARHPWKRYEYVGSNRVKFLFEGMPYTSYPVEFERDEKYNGMRFTAVVITK